MILLIVFACVGAWLSAGWRLAGPVARRNLARADAEYSFMHKENRAGALWFGVLVLFLWPVGALYLTFTQPMERGGNMLTRRWLPGEHLAMLQAENDRLRRELKL